MGFKKFATKDLDTKSVYHLLISGISPRPIALVGSMDNKGFSNLAPFSFFNAFGANPPIIGFSPALSGRTGLPKDTLLNVNVPKDIEGGINGYQVTRQGAIYFKDNFDRREDPRGRIYYWMSGEVKDTDNDLTSDGVAIKKGYVSITPLQLQMTNFDFINELNEWSF